MKDPQLASDWLTKLASSLNQISSFYHTIVTSVFLYQGSTPQSVQQAAKVSAAADPERERERKETVGKKREEIHTFIYHSQVLEKEVMKQKSLALEVFPMVLYRLGRESDPTTRLTILYTLPSLAVNKVSVPTNILT